MVEVNLRIKGETKEEILVGLDLGPLGVCVCV